MHALEEQNIHVVSGIGKGPPVKENEAFAIDILGRLIDPQQIQEIIIKVDAKGAIVRLKELSKSLEMGKAYGFVWRHGRPEPKR
jgi:hypothetical protein